ncbi:MAG: GNAT family N-acetyltransferase [Gammaproteobacteria bacterium]|nr:GNAT family N-acetyltransferase [Gammaproteobacteria bacterium]
MPATIREVTPGDAPRIAAGEYATAQTPGLLNAMPGEIPEAAFREKIESLQKASRGLYAAAEIGQDIAGHVLLEPMLLAANAHVCDLTIVVYPPWQGRGLGKQLLTYAIAWARSNPHVEKIELKVRASNARALALYRSLGFQEEGRLRKRVKERNGYLADIAMALFVDEPGTGAESIHLCRAESATVHVGWLTSTGGRRSLSIA